MKKPEKFFAVCFAVLSACLLIIVPTINQLILDESETYVQSNSAFSLNHSESSIESNKSEIDESASLGDREKSDESTSLGDGEESENKSKATTSVESSELSTAESSETSRKSILNIKENITLGVGEVYSIKDINSSSEISVESNSGNAISVDELGNVSANHMGNAVVAVSDGNKLIGYRFTVKKAPTYFSLGKEELSIKVGSRFNFNIVMDNDSSAYNISYASDNDVVLSVTHSGTITAKQKGTAVITAKTYNGLISSCTVTVIPEHENTAFQDLKATNPNYGSGDLQWQVNCQRCVPAYELRRRGYDVTAQPNDNDDYFDVWANCKETAERTHESAFEEMTEGMSGGATKEKIEALMKKWGDGARAQVTISWQEGSDGHTFIAEQINGKTYYLDPQSNNTDLSDIFKYVKTEKTSIWRIDNVDASELMYYCYISNTGRTYFLY